LLKNELFVNSGLVVRSTETRGYGVFTTKFIQSGSIIEECVVSEEIIRDNEVFKSIRFFGRKYNGIVISIIPHGFGCVYNHSENPNIMWAHVVNIRVIIFTATRDIKENEELRHDYGKFYLDF
jgi:SET domain-containing protein